MSYGFWADFSMLLLGVISALLILVVLLQRGRGGGLAGAFGGLGGQSAFGTKAGDVFTKITIGLVTAWVLLAGVSGVLARKGSEKADDLPTEAEVEERTKKDESGSSMNAIGESTSEDATDGDDATGDGSTGDGSTGDDATGDDATGNDENADDKTSPSEGEDGNGDATDEAATDTSEAASLEKADTEATPADSEGDAESTPADSETATPDTKE